MHGGAVAIREALLPSPLLPPPAVWVRCKIQAHHHPPLGVHQVASGGTATLTLEFQFRTTRDTDGTPSAPSTENNKSGAVRCEQCLSITSLAGILKHVHIPIVCVFCMCVHVLTSYSS